MKDEASRLRQLLLETTEEIRRQLDFFLRERGPLIRGALGTRSRVCGAPNCHCAKGELHESKYLSASDHGATRQVHVPASDEVRVAGGVERYRRYGEARTKLAARLQDLRRQQLELVDALGRSLLEPYPPDNPLPPPKRRGRPAKRGRSRDPETP